MGTRINTLLCCNSISLHIHYMDVVEIWKNMNMQRKRRFRYRKVEIKVSPFAEVNSYVWFRRKHENIKFLLSSLFKCRVIFEFYSREIVKALRKKWFQCFGIRMCCDGGVITKKNIRKFDWHNSHKCSYSHIVYYLMSVSEKKKRGFTYKLESLTFSQNESWINFLCEIFLHILSLF